METANEESNMKKVVLLTVVAAALASWGASLTGATDKNPIGYRPGEAMTFTLTAKGKWP